MNKILLLVTLLLMATSASADCWINGQRYPTGSVVDGLTCQPDGSWG